MDYLTENVAVNLKRIRQSKGMSLDQASEQTGVSKSMLSQISGIISDCGLNIENMMNKSRD